MDEAASLAYTQTSRFKTAVEAFLTQAGEDPNRAVRLQHPELAGTTAATRTGEAHKENPTQSVPHSLIYHKTLASYVQQLSDFPSEGLALASYCQHIRRWEVPRSSYPEGLSGYKNWRVQLARFHTSKAFDVLEASGYSQSEDLGIFKRVETLLQKKTLKGGNDNSDDEEMQIFEDAICLTFLELEFADFMTKHTEEKMIGIVQKTWKKMGHRGRTVAQQNLAARLTEEAQKLLTMALTT